MSGNTANHRAAVLAAWVLQILLGVAIAAGGLLKLTGDRAMVELFDDVGAGQWLRVVVGALEVAGGLGLLVPRVRALAAFCLLLLLLGAAVVNVAVLDTSPLSALAFAVIALAVLLLRRRELARRPTPAGTTRTGMSASSGFSASSRTSPRFGSTLTTGWSSPTPRRSPESSTAHKAQPASQAP